MLTFWTGMLIGWIGGLLHVALALWLVDWWRNRNFDHTHFD